MLLERFGLWEARHERVASYSRGMTQRLALCRVLLHDPALLVLDEPYTALDAQAPSCSTRSSRSCGASAPSSSPPTTRRASSRSRRRARARHELRRRRARARAQGSAARAARPGHAAGDAALRRRGVRRLPLLAAGPLVETRRERACSGSRSSSPRCSVSAAPSCPSASSGCSTALVLAPCDRSAIWLAKSLATFAFLVARRGRRAAASSRSSSTASTARRWWRSLLADIGICAVGTFVGAMAVVTRARDLLLPLLFLPLAIPIVIGGVGASVVGLARAVSRLSRPLRRCSSPLVCWASFEYVVTE